MLSYCKNKGGNNEKLMNLKPVDKKKNCSGLAKAAIKKFERKCKEE